MYYSDEKTNPNGGGNAYFGDMDINIKSIGYFIKVIEYGNISKAAENLYVSQPYLSKTIKGLEERLGFDLFIREKNKLIITPEGMEFYKAAKPLIHSLQKNIKNIKSMKAPKINMAVLYTLDFMKMRDIGLINKDFPLESCEVDYLDPFKTTQKLNENVVDIAISTMDYIEYFPDYEIFPLGKINRSIIVSSGNELANRKSVSFKDLEDKEIVVCVEANWSFETSYFMLEKFCQKHGINVANIIFKDNVQTSFFGVLSDTNKFFLGSELLPFSSYEGLVSVPIEGWNMEIIAVANHNLSKNKKELLTALYNKME